MEHIQVQAEETDLIKGKHECTSFLGAETPRNQLYLGSNPYSVTACQHGCGKFLSLLFLHVQVEERSSEITVKGHGVFNVVRDVLVKCK